MITNDVAISANNNPFHTLDMTFWEISRQ